MTTPASPNIFCLARFDQIPIKKKCLYEIVIFLILGCLILYTVQRRNLFFESKCHFPEVSTCLVTTANINPYTDHPTIHRHLQHHNTMQLSHALYLANAVSFIPASASSRFVTLRICSPVSYLRPASDSHGRFQRLILAPVSQSSQCPPVAFPSAIQSTEPLAFKELLTTTNI